MGRRKCVEAGSRPELLTCRGLGLGFGLGVRLGARLGLRLGLGLGLRLSRAAHVVRVEVQVPVLALAAARVGEAAAIVHPHRAQVGAQQGLRGAQVAHDPVQHAPYDDACSG